MSVTDEDILNYCDGVMEQERATQLKQAAQNDPELAHRILLMEASQLPYEAAFSQQPHNPALPDALINRIEKMVKLSASNEINSKAEKNVNIDSDAFVLSRGSWNFMVIAASLAICFLLGHSMADRQNKAQLQSIQKGQNNQEDWVRRVANYQTLYTENTLVSIVSDTEKASTLLSRIEGSSVLQTDLPDLSSHGYTFVRAQELGYHGEPLVQLVYYKPGVAPLAFCYMPSSDEQSTHVRIGDHEGLRTADWIQNGQRFIIVGEESEAVMQSLYELASELWI